MRLTAILLALACVLLAISTAYASAAPRAFGTPRFQTNDTGDIQYVGNTLSTCATGTSSNPGGISCAAARAGSTDANAINNNFANEAVNVAPLGGTYPNSSQATFRLPTGATVLWAGLYWGTDPGDNVANPPKTIRLRTPGTPAGTPGRVITAADADFNQGVLLNHNNAFAAFANVTDIVRAAGGGVYTAGDIPMETGAGDGYGGWNLVIVVKDANSVTRNLTVFDGFQNVSGTNTINLSVSGFTTPPTGPINSKFGIVAYEGDRGITGDFAKLNGVNLTDAASPATNFFNSSLTTLAARRTGSTPDYDNQLGFDAKILDASSYIKNNDRSASIQLGSNGDTYGPSAVTLATELFAPKFVPTKSVANVTPNRTGATRRGDTLRYTVSYRNSGGDDAAGVRIDDSIPANTSFVPGSLRITSPGATRTLTDQAGDDAAEYDGANGVVRFRPGANATATNGGTVAVNDTATVTFDVQVDDDLADNTRIDNIAQASYRAATSGTSFADLPTPVATTFVRAPDLQIAKTITTAPIGAGDNEKFSLSVTNTGGAPTSGRVTVTDVVPADAFPTVRGASGTGWTCGVAGQTVTCTRDDALAGGEGYPPITIDVTAAGNLPGTIQNDSTVAGGGDSNTTNNTGTATGQGTNRADLNVSKRFGQAEAIVGNTVTWTMDVRNDGPSTATNTVLEDNVPAGLTVTRVVPSRGACSAAPAISCALGDLAANTAASVTVTATVTGAPGTISNTATAESRAAGNTPAVQDPNTANNSSTATLTVNPSADVSIRKEGPAVAPNAGAPYSFTLTVGNAGPNTAQNVSVTDGIPANFTVTGTSQPAGVTCQANAQRVFCDVGTLPANQTRQITITGTSATGGVVSNSATVDSTTADPDGSNNSSTATVNVGTLADVSLVKRFTGDNPATAGGTTTVSLRAYNNGPSTAANVSIVDTLPAGLTFVAGQNCSAVGQTVTCAVGDIPAATVNNDTSVLREFTVTVANNARGNVTNTARASSPTTTDPFPDNNSSSASVALTANADLAITNVPNVQTVDPGGTVRWTVTATNIGATTADNARFTVRVPDGVTGASVVSSTGTGVNCTGPTNGVITCNVPTLAANQSFGVVFTGTVSEDAAGTTLTDPASVTSDTGDANLNNNQATASVPVGRRYRITVTKTPSTQTVAPNQAATFTLTARNAGPNAAPDVVLRDTIPAGTVLVSADPGCATNAQNARLIECTVGTLANNESASRTLTIRTTNANAGSTITNTLAYETSDPTSVDVNRNTPAGTASANVVVSSSADLSVTNVPRTANAVVGQTVTWDVVGTNNGPSPAAGASFTVPFPAGVTNVQVTQAPGGAPATCSVNNTNNTVTCTATGTLAPGASIPAIITGTIDRSAAGTTVSTTAEITGTTPDPALANNRATATVDVGRRYELSVDKVALDPSVQPGDTARFELRLTNAGPNTATNVRLVDQLPANTTLVSGDAGCVPPSGGTTVTCTVASIAPNTTVTRTITIRTSDANSGDTIRNTVQYQTDDPVAIDVNKNTVGSNTDTADVAVAARADLSVTITPNQTTAVVGDRITWTVVGRNAGPDQAVTPTISVTVPAGVSNITPGPGCSLAGRVVTCNTDSLNPNASFTGAFTGTIDGSIAGTNLDVPATIDSPTVDQDRSNNSATSRVVVGPQYRLKMEKTADQPRVGPNQDITYTLKITNNGPNPANGVTLVDPLPANTTLVSATQGCTVVGTTVSCPVGTLAPNASESRQITVRTSNATAGTTVTNSATYTTTDPAAVDLSRGTADAIGTASVEVTPLVDLGITKSVTPGRVTAGGEVVYTLDVVNNGPNGATGVVVTDALPAGLTVLQTSPTQGSCSTAGRTVRCDLGALAAGGRAQVNIRARADNAGTLNNQAGITSDQADANPADNTSANVPLVVDPAPAPPANPAPTPAPADLVLNKELISKTVEVGRVLTYRITVTNKGGSVARGVRVTDVPSRAVSVLGVKPTVGSCPGRSPITCNLGDLAPGQTAQVTVSVRVNVPGKLSNAATAVASGSPEVPAETDVADTSVRRLAASVSVKKTASARTVRGGSSVRFTIRVKNFTRKTVRKVLVCDTLPRGLVFQKASPLKVTGRKACGTIATLKAGQVRTFVVTVRAESRKTAKTLRNAARAVVPNELSSKASRAIRVTPGPGATGNGGVTG